MTLPIYTIADGFIFQDMLNKVAIILGTASFASAIKLAVLFSIIGTILLWIKTHDLKILAKWFMIYISITQIALYAKGNVAIIDSADNTNILNVGNIPMALALPASFITSIGFYIDQLFETTNKTAVNLSYASTGIMFGQKVFISTNEIHILNEQLLSEFQSFFESCIDSDVRISHKYSYSTLFNTNNPWKLIGKNPSPLFRADINESTLPCNKAYTILENKINKETKQVAAIFLRKLFNTQNTGSQINSYIPYIYTYYTNTSAKSDEIIANTLIRNAIILSIASYAKKFDINEQLVNLSDSYESRKAWQYMGSLIIEFMPVLNSTLMLILIAMFPILCLLAFQISMWATIFKSYIFTMCCLETWPALFSVLNSVSAYFVQYKIQAIAPHGITIANTNQIAALCYDSCTIFGYCALIIPFFSFFITRGFFAGINHVSQIIQSEFITTTTSTAHTSTNSTTNTNTDTGWGASAHTKKSTGYETHQHQEKHADYWKHENTNQDTNVNQTYSAFDLNNAYNCLKQSSTTTNINELCEKNTTTLETLNIIPSTHTQQQHGADNYFKKQADTAEHFENQPDIVCFKNTAFEIKENSSSNDITLDNSEKHEKQL